MVERSDSVQRCLDIASNAIDLGCQNPIDRHAYLKLAQDWAVHAYKVDRAERAGDVVWAAAGFKDTELGVNMEPEVGYGTSKVYARVQA